MTGVQFVVEARLSFLMLGHACIRLERDEYAAHRSFVKWRKAVEIRSLGYRHGDRVLFSESDKSLRLSCSLPLLQCRTTYDGVELLGFVRPEISERVVDPEHDLPVCHVASDHC